MKRTPDNCKLRKFGQPKEADGKCKGFARSETDNEPCVICKECEILDRRKNNE